ncbi:MAG: endopeptidase La, partial [Succinivibrionaceae bacterium]|nr:endopeptidase La [Succinivibrionaceae bacterium]
SAGVTMATALLSLALNKAPAKGYAMTGELTLTGKVLAIGGIREKSLAAKRLNIKKLICPKANESDVNDLPEFVKKGIEYHFVETYEDVAKILFPTLFKK